MRRNEFLALAGITALAAALRLWGIGEQSFWLDEAFTVDLVERPLGNMLSTVAETESTPPLYYVLAWPWGKLFGTGEAGLRTLSALFGTLAVPAAWRLGREVFDSARVGLVAAALVAVNPFFVWYSQEARSYSLLVLLTTLSLLYFARALRDRTPRSIALWVVVAALALSTHYFAAFLLVPKALWLVWATRERAAWIALGALAAVGAALAPLAIHQRDLGHTSFIADLGLGRRIADLPKKLVTGELGTPTPLIGPLAGLIAAVAIVYALRRWPHRAGGLLALAVATALVPLVLALAGSDYLLPRNLIVLYVPLIVVVAAGLGAAGRLGTAGAVAICAVAIVVNAEVVSDAKLQRDDWRGAAKALGPAAATRVVIVTPDFAKKPLQLYAGAMRAVPPEGTAVTEVVAIGNARPPSFNPYPIAPSGIGIVSGDFQEVERVASPSYILIRFRSPQPAQVTPQTLDGTRFGRKPAAILLQTPKGPAQ